MPLLSPSPSPDLQPARKTRFHRSLSKTLALSLAVATASAALGAQTTRAQTATDPFAILFVGNSFTYGFGATAQTYNANTITDENGTGYGGVPAIFKEFTVEKNLFYDVHIEAVGGQSLQYHLDNKAGIIGQSKWDAVVLQGLSTEPTIKAASSTPSNTSGNRPTFISNAQKLEQLVHSKTSTANLYLYETWSRADLTYLPNGPYFGSPIETMGHELHDGYYQAFSSDPNFTAVVPAGDAWLTAFQLGIADRNPYDGTDPGKINLWTVDSYHASNFGYYLNALLMFGEITGQDPRTLGAAEQAAAALGITPIQALALQSLAYDQLNAPVPEPATWALLMIGGGCALLVVQRNRRKRIA